MAEDRHDEDSADRDFKLGTEEGGTGIGELFAAVEQGNVEVVQALLNHGADVNKSDKHGKTALFAAAGQGNAEVVQALLSHGADVNKSFVLGKTALHAAVEQGNVEVVQALLSHGADVNKSDADGFTALHTAARQGNVEVVQALLSHGADVNKSDADGFTALHTAARQGNVEVVQALLSHGADVNKANKDRKTALFAAAEQGNVEVVQALLSHGADVNKSFVLGKTALHAAVEQGNVEVVQALLSHGAAVNKSYVLNKTALHTAARQGNVEVVQALLTHGADVNQSAEWGRTALFTAAEQRSVEVVQALLSHGAAVNKSDKHGKTALFAAAGQGNVEVVQALLSHGADVNKSDKHGKTALFAAAGQGNVEVVQALLSHGADVNKSVKQCKTALHAAVEQGNVEVVQALLTHGADVNQSAEWGRTALFAAAEQRSVEVVQALLSHGAAVNKSYTLGKTALFAAAGQGNVEVVQALLSHGADVNKSDKHGQTALFAAAGQGNVEVVQALLSHGADVNKSDKQCKTALHAAVEQGNVEVVQALLSHGAAVNKSYVLGKTALFLAAVQGNVEVVQALLSHGADVNKSDKHAWTALHTAARQGNVEVVQALLSHGADVNKSDAHGWTALYLAARQGSVEVVQALLSHGADVNKSDADGFTALHTAARQGNVEVVQALLSHGADVNKSDADGFTALHTAARQGNVEVVQALLSHGADVNKANKDRKTALFAAAEQGNVEVVQALLSHGVDVNKSFMLGKTALHTAATQGNAEVVQALLSHGADVNKSDADGWTALHTAAEQGNVEVVQPLLSHGADVNKSDADGWTGLHTAAEQGNVEVVQALLSHGADGNQSDGWGKTALFAAAEQGNVEVVQALLSHGADVNQSDGWGKSALFAAAEQGNVEVVQALLSHGVEVNKSDEHGKTALFAAAEQGNVEVIQALLTHGADVNKMENVETGRVDVNAVDHFGNSALFYIIHLIMAGQSADTIVELLQAFLKYGADLNIINATGESVLSHYLSFTKTNGIQADLLQNLCVVCHFLIGDVNVNVNVRPEGGITVVHLVLQLLQDSLRGNVPSIHLFQLASSILHSSTCSRSAAKVRDDTNGDTPLHLWASLKPKNQTYDQSLRDLMEDLFACGGQVNSTNAVGKTPLHVAQTWTAMKVLLDKGAAPDAADQDCNTPLLCCIRNGALFNGGPWVSSISKPVVSDKTTTEGPLTAWNQLFPYGFDPLRSNHKGESALSLLLESATFDVIQAFLKATTAMKLHPCLVDSNGDTPLHVICRDGEENHFWKVNLIDFLVKSESSIVTLTNRIGETALHLLCQKKVVGPLSIEIMQRLRAYGADTDALDGKGRSCLDLVANNSKLTALLKGEVADLEIEPWLPWESKSEKHKRKLGQVARGQNLQRKGSLRYHTEPIGLGAFGRVHAGVNSNDGREVAVKCIERAKMCRPEDRNEIRKLRDLADCEHVVRYLSYHGDKDFLYIVLELMEGTLEELLDEGLGKDNELRLCRQILEGVEFLHCTNILHRDIKATNVLYKRKPILLVKLADFGLSGRAAHTVANTFSVMHSKAGTRCWMAPELLTKDAQHSPASDMFACGLLLHFVLSAKKHPFAPTSTANKNEHLIECETVTNIEKRTYSLDGNLPPEATHLVDAMLQSAKDQRPSAAESLRHPLFWSSSRKVRFLRAVGNTPEFKAPRHRMLSPSPVEQELEREFGSKFVRTWDKEIPRIYNEFTSSKKSRNYDTSSAVDLVRFVRNVYCHPDQLSPATQKSVEVDFEFLKKFPTLLMHVYRCVINHNWDSRQTIATAMTE